MGVLDRDLREPPRLPFDRAPAGICRVDGEKVKPPRRLYCSAECSEIYPMLFANSAWQAWRFARDVFGDRRARCMCCGAERVALELDHIRPLWSLTPAERLEWRWWLPYNLWLICIQCHRKKTALEAAARATLRRTGRAAAAGQDTLWP